MKIDGGCYRGALRHVSQGEPMGRGALERFPG